jgi:hypothetical protein
MSRVMSLLLASRSSVLFAWGLPETTRSVAREKLDHFTAHIS